jgi:hypothetical protein
MICVETKKEQRRFPRIISNCYSKDRAHVRDDTMIAMKGEEGHIIDHTVRIKKVFK